MKKFDVIRKNLVDKGFEVNVFETTEQARDHLVRELEGKSVGIGGSATVDELGIYDVIKDTNDVRWHWKAGIDPSNCRAIINERNDAMDTDVYISSANAISETGEIVNIDGAGNRVASTLWGHEKVIFVVGRNKMTPTYDDAVWRARNVAAPKRAQQTNAKTPCAVKGDKCYDCKGPGRVCRGLVTIFMPMLMQEFEVILIDEDLGL